MCPKMKKSKIVTNLSLKVCIDDIFTEFYLDAINYKENTVQKIMPVPRYMYTICIKH